MNLQVGFHRRGNQRMSSECPAQEKPIRHLLQTNRRGSAALPYLQMVERTGRIRPTIFSVSFPAVHPYYPIMKVKFTAILRFEEDMVVALSPELDIASQGETYKEALSNLKEAVELFLETASPSELEGRLSEEAWITQFETDYAPA